MSGALTLGVVSVSFRDRAARDIASAAKDAGLSAIEWGSDVHARPGSADVEEIAATDAKLGLSCSSYGTYFRLCAAPDPVKGDTPADIAPYLSAAKALGTDTLRIWMGSRSSDKYSPEERAELLAAAAETAKLAAASGMKLYSEFHLGTFNDCAESARLIAGAGIGTYWQPFQTLTVRENEKIARALRGAVNTVHVFNWSLAGRHALSEGVDDWKRYLEVLGSAETLLLEFMPDDRLETLKGESDALRLIAGV